MKSILSAITLILLLASCSSQRGNYQSFYNAHSQDADFALSFPKWAAMPFIDKEDRKVIKSMSEGMRRIKVLYDKEQSENKIYQDFRSHAETHGYLSYLYLRDDETNIDLYTREDDDNIHEIILSLGADEESVIVALLGKMSKEQFIDEIGPHLVKARQ